MATPARIVSSTEVLGARLLREIEAEEGTLEDLLTDLRIAAHISPSKTGIPALDQLWKAHGLPRLNISGRGLPLLYHVITTLVSAPTHGTVAVIDLDGRFSASHVRASRWELKHIHVFRPTRANLAVTMEGLQRYMLYGEHGSRGREWMGTLVNGGGMAVKGADVVVGWRGWLRVEREAVGGFAEGVAVEEAWGERERRQEVVDSRGWKAGSEIGEFGWR